MTAPAVLRFIVPGPPVGKARARVMTLAYRHLMTRDIGPLFMEEVRA